MLEVLRRQVFEMGFIKIQTMASIFGSPRRPRPTCLEPILCILDQLNMNKILARSNVEPTRKAALRYHESVRMLVMDKLYKCLRKLDTSRNIITVVRNTAL